MPASSGGEGWRLVRPCPRCGRPADRCRCGPASGGRPAGPATFRLRLEKRRGKPVTVAAAEGATRAQLRSLLKELKGKFGAGGTAKQDRIELQGDHRERLRSELAARSYRVKG